MRVSEQGDALLVGRGGKSVDAEGKSESQLSRVKSKNREYCRLFGLPSHEELVEEYNCALQRKILLQGKMYVFSSYVCFYSNVFGYITKRSLALKDVTSITKAKNVGFPNSIKIVHKGKQMFFTSFLSREDAFRLIIALWYECSPYARLSGILPASELISMRFSYSGVDDQEEQEEQNQANSSSKAHENENGGGNSSVNVTPKAHRKTRSNEDNLNLSPSASPSMGSPVVELKTALSADGKRKKSRTKQLERRHSISELNIKSSEILELSEAQQRRKSSRGSSSEGINLGTYDNFSPDDDEPLSGDNDPEVSLRNEVVKSKKNIFLGTIKCESPPGVSSDMDLIREAEFPICAYHFFATFLSDKSSFLKDFHEEQGDKNITFSQWKQMDANFPGYMRNMTFSTPLAFSIGPESTHCDQTQRYSFYQYERGNGEELALVYETSQVNTDVPYGDYFKVCTRWDIVDTSEHSKSVENDEDIEQYTNHTCKFKVHISVPFNKSTIMKGTIVQKTKAQCTSYFDKLITAINKHIYSLMETSMMGSQMGTIDDQELTSRIPAEWRQQIKLMLNLKEEPEPDTNRDFFDLTTFPSFTEQLGDERRFTLKRVLGATSLVLKILIWVFTQLYKRKNEMLLLCSLALNICVLYIFYRGGIPMYTAEKVPEVVNDNFWKTKRTHITREIQILEDYLVLLKNQYELAKSQSK